MALLTRTHAMDTFIGFYAICQCDCTIDYIEIVDLSISERKDAGKTLGQWISRGYVIKPYQLGSNINQTSCICIQEQKKPTGYIANCQCNKTIGAIDLNRAKIKEQNEMLSNWLRNWCTIEPKFDSWEADVSACDCKANI